MGLDVIIPHLHLDSQKPEGVPSSLRRSTLLMFAVTLHNIPEGMAVGLAFALAAAGRYSGRPFVGCCAGHRNGYTEFPGGRGYIAAPAPGGPLGRQGFFIWEHFGRG